MDDIFATVQRAFQMSFDVDPASVTLDTAPADLPAWDSVGNLTLAGNLETLFALSLEVDEMMEMENVRAIVRIIGRKKHAPSS